MKILDPGSTSLSNAEVLAHLNSLKSHYDSSNRRLPDSLKTVIQDVNVYFNLAKQPTSVSRPDVKFTPERIEAVVTTLKATPFKLLKGEVLQILNQVPTTKEDLALLVEYDEQRFGSTEQWLDILKVVREQLVPAEAGDTAAGHAESGAERNEA